MPSKCSFRDPNFKKFPWGHAPWTPLELCRHYGLPLTKILATPLRMLHVCYAYSSRMLRIFLVAYIVRILRVCCAYSSRIFFAYVTHHPCVQYDMRILRICYAPSLRICMRILGICYTQGRIKLVGGPGALILVGAPNPCVKLTSPSYLLTNNNLLTLWRTFSWLWLAVNDENITSSMLSWC